MTYDRSKPPIKVLKIGDITPTKENLAIIWDFVKYSHPWVFGDIEYLFKHHAPTSIQQWRLLYNRSGTERSNIIAQSPPEVLQAMNHYRMVVEDPDGLESLPDVIKQLNYVYGRTPEQIQKIAWSFTVMAVHNKINLTRDDAQAYIEKQIYVQPFHKKTAPIDVPGTVQPDATGSKGDTIPAMDGEAERTLAPGREYSQAYTGSCSPCVSSFPMPTR